MDFSADADFHRLNRTGSMPLKTFLRLCEKQANLRIVTIPILSDFSYDFIEAIANEETCKNLEIVKIRGVINSWQNTCTLAQELIRVRCIPSNPMDPSSFDVFLKC